MASCSEIEKWLAIVGTGITGLRLLKDYNIQTPELEYFTDKFGNGKMAISAFAPSPFKNQYETRLQKIQTILVSHVEQLMRAQNVSSEIINNALNEAEELYSLLRDMHQTVVSGFIIV